MTLDEKHIEKAQNADFDALVRIMNQANQYAIDKAGEPMWTAMEFVYRQLHAHIESSDCFVMRDEDKIVATMTITDKDILWGEAGADGKALYIHKLMKDPAMPAQNVGLTFLLFAAHQALKQDKKYIRCDTVPSQKHLVNYYLKLGFIKKGAFAYPTTERDGIFLEVDAEELLKRIAQL